MHCILKDISFRLAGKKSFLIFNQHKKDKRYLSFVIFNNNPTGEQTKIIISRYISHYATFLKQKEYLGFFSYIVCFVFVLRSRHCVKLIKKDYNVKQMTNDLHYNILGSHVVCFLIAMIIINFKECDLFVHSLFFMYNIIIAMKQKWHHITYSVITSQ